MGKVSRYIYAKEIKDSPDEGANHLELHLSHDGYHLHYRNLRIRIKENEMPMWKEAFSHAKKYIKHQNLL
jgi:hypothetical protein